jgi:hypothetical protein
MLLRDFKGYIARQPSRTSTATAAPERRYWSILIGAATRFVGSSRDRWPPSSTRTARAVRRFIQPPLTLFGEPIQWVDTARYLGVTLDTRLTGSPHIDEVRKKTARRIGMLGPLLNRKSDLSVRNGVLLYKQLVRPVMDYACPAWRSAARTHVQRLQMLQSKCLRLATGAPWYVSNRQIHEDLGEPLFADQIRAVTACFDSKLVDVGNLLVRQLGRYLRWPRVDPVAWSESQGRLGPAGQSRPSPAMAKSTKRIAFGADQPSAFRLTWLRFSVIFLSCKENARIYDAKSGHGPHSPPPGAVASSKGLKKVARLLFATEPVWAQNPDSQPTKVYRSHY